MRKRGGCAEKAVALIRGDLRGCRQMPRPFGSRVEATVVVERPRLAVEKSAEAVLPAGSYRGPGRAEREAEAEDACARGDRVECSQPREGPRWKGRRVKPDDTGAERSHSSAPGRHRSSPRPTELVGAVSGPRESRRGATTCRAERRCRWRRRNDDRGTAAVVETALANGALSTRCGHLPAAARAEGNDPQALGRERMLGVPAALDRLIQQALAQVLTPVFDPHFHPHSFGFRPGRSAASRCRGGTPVHPGWCGVVRSMLTWTLFSIAFSTTL